MNQDQQRPLSLSQRMRKPGAKELTMHASAIKDQATGNGVVVQTVRDSSGTLIYSKTLNLSEVEAQGGLPLPMDAIWR